MGISTRHFATYEPRRNYSLLEIELPQAPAAAGFYKPMVMVADLAYLSGHLPIMKDGSLLTEKLEMERPLMKGLQQPDRLGSICWLLCRAGLGSLNRVVRVVKLLGLVNSPAGFSQHPQVINGCSELFKEVFGEDHGVGARSALEYPGYLPGLWSKLKGFSKFVNGHKVKKCFWLLVAAGILLLSLFLIRGSQFLLCMLIFSPYRMQKRSGCNYLLIR